MARRIVGIVIAAAATIVALAGGATAEPVQVMLGDTRLNGNLEMPAGRPLTEGIAIIVHDTMGFSGDPAIVALQKNLKVRGVATLAITLSLGIDDRRGPRPCAVPHAYREADVAAELERWVDWVAHHGVRAVDYIGFSGGATELINYLQKQKGGRRVVLMAPYLPTAADLAAGYRKQHGKELAPALDAARKVRDIRRVDYLTCPQAMVQGGTFTDAYSEVPPERIAGIVQPTLVVIAGNDEVVPELEPRLPQKVRHVVIEGSDHNFRDLNSEDAADAIAEFLRE